MHKHLGMAAILAAVICCSGSRAEANRDRGSWKKTLHDKAVYFEKNTRERHDILGTFPSTVRLVPPRHYAGSQDGAWKRYIETGELPPGWIVDHGTTGISNVAHSSSWTGCYLTGEAFRVAFMRDKYGTDDERYRQAYERANEVIRGIRVLTLVSGQPGYLARGLALGHGVSYEERGGTGQRDLWAQGAGEFRHLRYRGGPSHHNYDQVFRGLGIYYFVAADDYQKRMIREIVADMSEWAHLKNDMVVMHVDGERESTQLIGGWRGLGGSNRPSGGSVMALTGLKIAHKITGNERTKQLYDHWVQELGLLDPERNQRSIMGRPRSNYDDTDHLLGDLYLLNIIEEDPELLAYYRRCVKDSWEVHKQDKVAWFNYVYRAVLGDEYADTESSLWNLQSFPTCRLFQPHLNSIRTDIEFLETDRGKQSLHPLPLYARPTDNEYEWKGSPYALDGRLARIVKVLEVSPHDEYAQLAADEGGIPYWSNTKGEIWHRIDGLGGVDDFLFSPEYPWICFAATTSGVYRSLDGGEHWGRTLSEPAERIKFDPENLNVLYAVGSRGVYKSADLGERDMGVNWRNISGEPFPGGDNAYAVDPRGDSAKLYVLAPSGFYSKHEGDEEWSHAPRATRTRGFSDVPQVRGRPLWVRVDETTEGRLFRAVYSQRRRRGSGVSISVSEDGGETWSPVSGSSRRLRNWREGRGNRRNMTREQLRAAFERSRRFQITDLRVDRKDPNIWYGLAETGVAVTRDGGETWSMHDKGLDIPRVGAIWTPRHADFLVAGTPAGMYVSHDHGESFQDTPLILQGGDAIRSELGGIAYLIAYWMGRHHNFITEEDANAEWWTN